jgi:hypothetical protein
MTHPITPPPELVKQWREKAPRCRDGGIAREDWLMTRAAQWGADQELEACCKWLDGVGDLKPQLRTARRPKPPSLKEQALEQLDGIAAVFRMSHGGNLVCDTIRRALEELPDD